jgi:hypothetical protein
MRRIRAQGAPVGFAVVACAACCAGPIAAALGIGTMVALGMLLVGAVGAGSIALALVAVVAWKRDRRAARQLPPAGAVSVTLSRRP